MVLVAGAAVQVDRGGWCDADACADCLPIQAGLVAQGADPGGLLERRGLVDGVNLARCFKQVKELIDIERAAIRATLGRFAGAFAAGGVSFNPAGVLGVIEDQRECPQRLIDRGVAESTERLAGASVTQCVARLGGVADLLVLVVDALR
jgi:hypothetical protein